MYIAQGENGGLAPSFGRLSSNLLRGSFNTTFTVAVCSMGSPSQSRFATHVPYRAWGAMAEKAGNPPAAVAATGGFRNLSD
ncbi:MAG: hypothetical protein ACOCWR_10065, partial [Oceanidesulfovibrio sp.]